VDESTPAQARARAIEEFSSPAHPQNCLILEVSACSLGTDFATADAVVIYDSDGHPSGDMQSLGRARRMGDPARLLVFRLYCSATLEEVVVAVRTLNNDQMSTAM
jgi:SNF2 family DNA or RNA helicase